MKLRGENKMWNMRALIRIASIAGPALFKILRKYGPEIRKLLAENPDLRQKLEKRIRRTAQNKKTRTGENLAQRIAMLREQTTYLYASANTPEIAAQVRFWRSEIGALENSLPLLAAMSEKRRKSEVARLHERLDDLSVALLDLTISDDIEDVWSGDMPKQNRDAEGDKNDGGVQSTGY